MFVNSSFILSPLMYFKSGFEEEATLHCIQQFSTLLSLHNICQPEFHSANLHRITKIFSSLPWACSCSVLCAYFTPVLPSCFLWSCFQKTLKTVYQIIIYSHQHLYRGFTRDRLNCLHFSSRSNCSVCFSLGKTHVYFFIYSFNQSIFTSPFCPKGT